GQHDVHDGRLGVGLGDGGERRLHAARDPHGIALGLQRHPEAVGDGGLVVHDEHGAAVLHAFPPRLKAGAGGDSTGNVTVTRVPSPTTLWRAREPPWPSMTVRAMAMPSPVPSGLVVKKKSKARESVSSLMPHPVSWKVTVMIRVAGA